MITTTKQEIRKAVMEALEKEETEYWAEFSYASENGVLHKDFPSVADRVAETLGGEG